MVQKDSKFPLSCSPPFFEPRKNPKRWAPKRRIDKIFGELQGQIMTFSGSKRHPGVSLFFVSSAGRDFWFRPKNPDPSKVPILRSRTPAIQVQTPPMEGPMILRAEEIHTSRDSKLKHGGWVSPKMHKFRISADQINSQVN